ncbi:SMI1/KNR4 family protein [Prevotella sp. 10(H)]|uniref:SMI1/KNR4 family protein n=1 Tax=Prevotella sp. 10(H) TaxID=1158294 RepID=UPI00068D9E3B|nr:SMI1/KNR4 family protein [Prevotella sp. 10(H)]
MKSLNIQLPDDYASFLQKNDCSVFCAGYFYIEDLDEYILMDVFYGIKEPEESVNLIEVNNEYKEDITVNSILIGEDAGGAFILLVNNPDNEEKNEFDNGIYYYDHAYFFECSDDRSNTYFICKSFTEFIQLLETTELPE